MATAILWFRRDLRLADNPALSQSLQAADKVIPVYIHAPEEDGAWADGSASRWWLRHSLIALDESLRRLGSRLLVRRGPSLQVLRQLIRETGAGQVYWNRLYEPASIARDTTIKQALRENGLTLESFNAALLHEPWEVTRDKGEPYRVFTPYWKALLNRGLGDVPLPEPASLPPLPIGLEGMSVDELELSPKIPWDGGLRETWVPGEAGAWARLESFLAAVGRYAEERDRPDHDGSSRLAPHLHFGEIGPRQIVRAIHAPLIEGMDGADCFTRQLTWREFAHHLLLHYPNTPESPLDRRFSAFPWNEPQAEQLRAWQQGKTGIPLVDAGMRQLWHTGWMHNRVRMVAASFLVKNLRIHWLEGARWF
ncbi:partial Deoxyribodipyrimidine photo-lyase, partial [Anaerolineae bacterium]